MLEQQPQLHFARDLLGMAYLNAHQPADAMREFTRLTVEQPANAVYHLHKGYAHYAQNQYAPALDCYREARKLDPQDTRSLVATADCLVAQKQYEPALLELDRAIGLDGQVDFNDFVFFMRKVQIQLLRDRGDLAEQELDQIFKILPDDPEVKKYVATRLASLASDLFAMKRSADANRLLVRCKQLDPSRKSMEYTFPARTRLRIDALPAASQEWLKKHAGEWSAGKLKHNAKGGPIFLLILAIGLQLVALNAGFNTRRAWDGGQQLMMCLFLIGAPMLLALSIRMVQRVSRSPYGKYTTIHPCHLLQVEVDKLTVWPLVNLHDVGLTHHSTNGVYSHTICRLNFAGTVCNITIRGQQASVDWANLVLEQRRKVLDLMGMGLLEAEDGFDLVPPSLLQPGNVGPKPPKNNAALKWYGGAAAVGAAMFAVAIPVNLGAAERYAWQSASRYPNLSAYRDYVEAFPSGKHVVGGQGGGRRVLRPRHRAVHGARGDDVGGIEGDRGGAAGAQGVGRALGERDLRVGHRLLGHAALPREGDHQRRPGVHGGGEQVARAQHHVGAARGVRQRRRLRHHRLRRRRVSLLVRLHEPPGARAQGGADHVRHQVSRGAVGDDLRVDHGHVAQVLRHPVRVVAGHQRRQGRGAVPDAAVVGAGEEHPLHDDGVRAERHPAVHEDGGVGVRGVRAQARRRLRHQHRQAGRSRLRQRQRRASPSTRRPGYSPELQKALDDIARSGKMSDETRRMLMNMKKPPQ